MLLLILALLVSVLLSVAMPLSVSILLVFISYLYKVIICHPLSLQNILKNFDKNRSGYSTLEKALRHMTAMAHHINEMKRRHEHAVRIQEVQSQLEDYEGEDLTRLGELVLEVRDN